MYEYHMVQVPQSIEVKEKHHVGNEAAAYLQHLVNKAAREGWEFYRVDSVGVSVAPGCLGALFGRSREYTTYHVVCFRREKPGH